MIFVRSRIAGAGQGLLLQVLYWCIDNFVASCRIVVLCLFVSRVKILCLIRMCGMLWLKESEINGASSVKSVSGRFRFFFLGLVTF